MAAGIKIGSRFAGYSIEGVLGRGGMGVVYLAEQHELGRKVAIKVIAPALASDPDYLARFKRESRVAAAIEHPNAIPIYEAGVADEEVPYLVMRYVDGVDLASLIRREGRLRADRAARIVEQVSGALDEAHARGLVHRDVKPGNIIVESRRGSEHAYLTDFGLTKQIDATSGVTASGRWVGTIDYASPEQIEGRDVDARSDVYSLGCVLFVALTGQLPFEREADVAKLYAHINEPPPVPSSMAPGVTAALDSVVARALAKGSDQRFPSAGDLGRAALAAATGSAIGEPERTVATGEAAPARAAGAPTVPSEGVAGTSTASESSEAAPDPYAGIAASPAGALASTEEVAPPTEAAAVAGGGQAATQRSPGSGRRGTRRARWLAGVAAAAAAVGLAVAVGVGAFSDGSGDAANGHSGKGGGGGSGRAASAVQFEPFTGSNDFTVDVPVGWATSYADQELPGQGRGQFRTQLVSPNGKLSLQILKEPDTPARERAATAESERSAEPGYHLVQAPTQETLGERRAWLYAYVHENEPGIGRATIYNYMFSDGGFGWRTRAAAATGADRASKAREIATEAASSFQLKP